MHLPEINIGVLSIGYPNFRYDLAGINLADTIQMLEKIEGVKLYTETEVVIEEDKIPEVLARLMSNHLDLLLLELGTYSYGSALMACLDCLGNCDFMMWAFREPIVQGEKGLPLNSLCALNMYTSFLYRMGRKNFSYLYGNPKEERIATQLYQKITAARIKKGLKKARFCVVGGRVPGFYLSEVDELRFRSKIGPEIVYYSIAELLHDAKRFEKEEVTKEMTAQRNMVAFYTSGEEALEKSARISLALQSYRKRNKITGFALKCWPELQELYQMAPCAAVSCLNQKGLLVSCEGDVTGLTTMYIQQALSSRPVFLTDMVNITEEGIVKLWHCGSAAAGIAADSKKTVFGEHPTMKNEIGVGGSFDLDKGDVLICKLSESTPYKMLLVEGTCIEPDRSLTGNQGDIRLKGSADQLLEKVVSEGIEHHYSMAYGADINIVKQLCTMLEIKVVTLD